MLRRVRDIDQAVKFLQAEAVDEGSIPTIVGRSTIIGNIFYRIRQALADPMLSRRNKDE